MRMSSASSLAKVCGQSVVHWHCPQKHVALGVYHSSILSYTKGYRFPSSRMTFAGKEDQLECRKGLFLKEELSDVVILVETDGSRYRYPCHGVILSAASQVFASMFESKLQEGETCSLTVTEINPEIMLIILTYIYCGTIDFDYWMTAIDVLRAAHKYQIESLINHCEIYLSENLTSRNVCYILDIAIMCDLCDLKTKCKEICQPGGFSILKSRPFKNLSACAVREILSIGNLSVATEMDIFRALWEWASTECCRKQMELTEENIFAEFLVFSEYVKFEYMTNEELDSLPKTTFKNVWEKNRKKLKNGEKVVDKTSLSDIAVTDPNTSYICKGLRSYLMTKIFRFGKSSVTSFEEGHLSLLRFSVDANVYLTSFVLIPLYDANVNSYFKSFRLVCKDKILIEWPNKDKEIIKLHNNGVRSASERNDTKFQELLIQVYGFVLLKAGVEYTLEVKPEVCKSCPLKWPSVSLFRRKRYREDEVKLFVHSQSSFGIDQMTFLRAT